jgi:hypothetical protein
MGFPSSRRDIAWKGLVARRKRKWRGSTPPDRSARKALDTLRRDFTPPQRAEVRWCGDLTEISTDEGKLLAAVACGGFSSDTGVSTLSKSISASMKWMSAPSSTWSII